MEAPVAPALQSRPFVNRVFGTPSRRSAAGSGIAGQPCTRFWRSNPITTRQRTLPRETTATAGTAPAKSGLAIPNSSPARAHRPAAAAQDQRVEQQQELAALQARKRQRASVAAGWAQSEKASRAAAARPRAGSVAADRKRVMFIPPQLPVQVRTKRAVAARSRMGAPDDPRSFGNNYLLAVLRQQLDD